MAVRIDFHTHVVPATVPDFAARYGDSRWPVFRVEGTAGRMWQNGVEVRTVPEEAWSVERRLEHMEVVGSDLHVLSPLPPLMTDWAEPKLAAEFSNLVNDGVAEMVHTAPGRLAGLGMVPLQDGPLAIRVLEQAHGAGLKGIQIGTRGGDLELDDPSLREFFTAASELDMALFVHPLIKGTAVSWTSRISGLSMTFGVGMTTDTSIAAAALILGGVTDELPDLRVCLAHGGGTFVWASPRIAHLWDATADPPLSELMRNVYVDTVVYERDNLDYLISRLGSDRVMWGTDYPLPAQAEQTGLILEGLPSNVATRVIGANAAAFLRLG